MISTDEKISPGTIHKLNISDTIGEFPMKDIFADESFNVRGTIAPIDVIDLAKSIEANGLLEPIVIQPITNSRYKYRIVAGHRRFVAHQVLKRETIKARLVDGLTELQARRLNFVENLDREELNILQEARGLRFFLEAGLTEQQTAEDLGKSRGWVQVRFMLLKLPPEIQEQAAAGYLNQSHIRAIYALPTKEKQFEAVKEIMAKKERGEKSPILEQKKKKDPLKKRLRLPYEIHSMQDHIRETLGNSLTTAVLGWCAGHNSDLEIYRDIEKECQIRGIPYHIPVDLTELKSFGEPEE